MTTDADSQSMVMTIDQGNSSAKLDVWKGLEPVRMLRLEELSVEMLLPLLGDDCFDGSVYCSVGHTDAKFLETLRRLMDWRMIVLTPSTPLPISIGYAGRETLGGDRVAAAAGAALLYSGECVLVVDSGTAVTIDLLDSHGCFVGGNISPGVAMRLRSLHESTDRLPIVEAEGDVEDFATDTVSAIRSGAVGGMVSEIADSFSRASSAYGCKRIALTGNDATLLAPLLRKRGLPVDVHPRLVGLGLLSIFRYVESLAADSGRGDDCPRPARGHGRKSIIE